MNLQYISDSTGKITGIFIPIDEWNNLKEKYKGIDHEEMHISDHHKNIVRERLQKYRNDPDTGLDFDSAMDEIEKEL